MSETLTIDDLVYEVRRSDRRRTLGITIERDGALILVAPTGCPQHLIERMGRSKALWVHTKLAEREMLFRPRRQREFVSGEAFFYLGRSHRLLLVHGGDDVPALRLHEGRFMLRRDAAAQGKEHFRDWYTQHLRPWIERRAEMLAVRVGERPKAIVIRDLGYRWGSCGVTGNLLFHWCVACLPPGIIEYLVAHELVHLAEPHHDEAFWKRLERVIPDYARRKRWLAENGGRYIYSGASG